ncbi:MAG TPA: hypothetical protein VML55_24770, partial [Planctomycetaceae bacterium]|nr:hypothetical protein [Planctomycetaceae bacterium]
DSVPTDAPDNGGGDPTDAPDVGGNGGGGNNPFSGGSAVLTIGDQTWEFDGVFCAFSAEVTQNENVPFSITSFTTSDTGARAQLDASVVDLSGAGEVSGENLSVTFNDVEDFENPSISWNTNSFEALGGQTPTLNIDGKNVRIEATFDDGLTELDIEAIPGSLEANCP